jgi:hypothetical protein
VQNASSGSKQGQTPERVPLEKSSAFGGAFLLAGNKHKKTGPRKDRWMTENREERDKPSPKAIT